MYVKEQKYAAFSVERCILNGQNLKACVLSILLGETNCFSFAADIYKLFNSTEKGCCYCLPCNHCSNWTWAVEQILAYGNRLRSTHCRESN